MEKTKILSVLLLFILGYSTYIVKQEVANLNINLSSVNHELDNCKESMHLLSAEWSYLNNPDRLQKLVKSQTRMEPVTGASLVGYKDIFVDNKTHVRTISARR